MYINYIGWLIIVFCFIGLIEEDREGRRLIFEEFLKSIERLKKGDYNSRI